MAIIASVNAIPLNTTARVAVLATTRIASRVSRPRWCSSRSRETMNSEQSMPKRQPHDGGDAERDDDRQDRHHHRNGGTDERPDHLRRSRYAGTAAPLDLRGPERDRCGAKASAAEARL